MTHCFRYFKIRIILLRFLHKDKLRVLEFFIIYLKKSICYCLTFLKTILFLFIFFFNRYLTKGSSINISIEMMCLNKIH